MKRNPPTLSVGNWIHDVLLAVTIVAASMTTVSQAQVMPMQTMSTAWAQPGYPNMAPAPVPARRAVPMSYEAPQAVFPATPLLHFDGRRAWLMRLVPGQIYNAVLSANNLQGKPYKWGGGHRSFYDDGYDCSGSTSHVLMAAGLLKQPITARDFMRYGEPGPGRFITIYARQNHVFMEICGLRLDAGGTSGGAPRGIFWRTTPRSADGWAIRHPRGF